jgi:hypothetical protein
MTSGFAKHMLPWSGRQKHAQHMSHNNLDAHEHHSALPTLHDILLAHLCTQTAGVRLPGGVSE